MAKLFKKSAVRDFENNIFKNKAGSSNVASCHYYSVISKNYFQKSLMIF